MTSWIFRKQYLNHSQMSKQGRKNCTKVIEPSLSLSWKQTKSLSPTKSLTTPLPFLWNPTNGHKTISGFAASVLTTHRPAVGSVLCAIQHRIYHRKMQMSRRGNCYLFNPECVGCLAAGFFLPEGTGTSALRGIGELQSRRGFYQL